MIGIGTKVERRLKLLQEHLIFPKIPMFELHLKECTYYLTYIINYVTYHI